MKVFKPLVVYNVKAPPTILFDHDGIPYAILCTASPGSLQGSVTVKLEVIPFEEIEE